MTAVIEVAGLWVRYSRGLLRDPVDAVCDVDLTVYEGESVGIVGESGCGKSTLLRTLVGLVPPTRGSVAIDGKPVTARAGRAGGPSPQRIQAVFQSVDAHLDPRWTPEDLVAETLAVIAKQDRDPAAFLDAVGLLHRRHVASRSLSGGERRRLGVARVLAVGAPIVLADEPCAGVDAGERDRVVDALKERTSGGAMVLVTHDLGLVSRHCERVVVMVGGRVVERCATEQLGRVPHHPYTDTLLRASGLVDGPVPNIGASGDTRGCPVAGRCPAAEPACSSEVQRLHPVSSHPGHAVACPHPVEPTS